MTDGLQSKRDEVMLKRKELKMKLREMILPKDIIATTFNMPSGFSGKPREVIDADYFRQYTAALIDNIDKLAASATKVYGWSDYRDWHDSDGWTRASGTSVTHTALLICIEPINKKVKTSEVVDVLRNWAAKDMSGDEMKAVADRIEKHGIEA